MGVWQVARHEFRHATQFIDRKTTPALIGVAILLGFGLPLVLQEGVHPDAGIFPADATGSPLEPALGDDNRFRFQDHGLAIRMEELRAIPERSERGDGALDAAREALLVWNEKQLRMEEDQAAAFPVRVNMLTQTRDLTTSEARLPQQSRSTFVQPETGPPVALQVDAATERNELRPSQVEPPFPIRSLILTFAYLIPMNFVAQLQAGTLHADRVRRRGLILLSAPVRPGSILLGRILPYAGVALLVWIAATILIGTNAWGAVAGLVMIAFVHAAGVIVGLLARSEREVTFLLTGLTTGYATFLFLPAVFTALPPVALLSPVSVVGAGIRGETIAPAGLVYAMMPLAVMALALMALAASLYREETLFAPRGIIAKASDGIDRVIRNPLLLAAAAALIVPWAFTLELFLVALIIPLGLGAVFPLIVIGAAFVEEALKGWLSVRNRITWGTNRFVAGIATGLGFYLGERFAFVLVLVNFDTLPQGDATLTLFGLGTLAQILAPLLVHIVAATIACSRSTKVWQRRLSFLAAAVFHATYNAIMVRGAL